MGFFDKLKGRQETDGWSEAYQAKPHIYYRKEDGSTFGALTVTEGVRTILPAAPGKSPDMRVIKDWRMVFVSITKDAVIGEADYFAALQKLAPYVLATDKKSILLKGLTLNEMEKLLESEQR